MVLKIDTDDEDVEVAYDNVHSNESRGGLSPPNNNNVDGGHKVWTSVELSI